jgi:AsmA protein
MLRRIVLLVSILVAVLIVAALAAVVLIDPDDYREQIAARASDQVGREVRLDGPIELRLFPWLAFEIRDASVGNPPDFDPAPALAEIGLARASIRLWPLIRGELEIGSVDFENATFTLVTGRDGRSNLDGLFAADPDPEAARAPADLSGLETGPVGLRGLTVVLLDLATDERQEIGIDSVTVDPFAPDRDVSFTLRGRFLAAGEVVIDDLRLDGVVRVASDLESVALSGLEAGFSLPAADATVRAEGDARVDLSGSIIEIEMPRLDLQMSLPDIRLGLTLTQPLTLALADPVRAAMPGADFRLADQQLTLSADLSLGDPVSGRLDISGQVLDLRALAALGGDEVAPDRAGEAVDFTPLRMFEFHSDLRVEELILAEGMRLRAVEAGSRLLDGRLVLDPMEAQLFGGRFDGRAEVDFNENPPHVRVQPRLSGVLVEQVVGVFSEHAPVAGRGDLALDLGFRGLSIAEILASLDGTGQFLVSDGVVRGIDLERLMEQELTVAGLANVRQVFAGETPFRTLSGGLRAEGGVITLPDLDLVAAGFGARGSGRIDFASDHVDYRIDLDLGESWQQRLPSSLRSATGGRIPLAIGGPVTAPVVSVDLAGIAERTLRDEAGRRLLERLDRPGRDAPDAEEDMDANEELDEPVESERTSRQLLRGLLESRERQPEPAEDQVDEEQDEEEDRVEDESDSDDEEEVDFGRALATQM